MTQAKGLTTGPFFANEVADDSSRVLEEAKREFIKSQAIEKYMAAQVLIDIGEKK